MEPQNTLPYINSEAKQYFKTIQSITKLSLALCENSVEIPNIVAKIILKYIKAHQLSWQLADEEIQDLSISWRNSLTALGTNNVDGKLAKQLAKLVGDHCYQQMFEHKATPRLISQELSEQAYQNDLLLDTADVDYILQNAPLKTKTAISHCMYAADSTGLCQSHVFALRHFMQSQPDCTRFSIPINLNNQHFICFAINKSDSLLELLIANSLLEPTYKPFETAIAAQFTEILQDIFPMHAIRSKYDLIKPQADSHSCGDRVIRYVINRHVSASNELQEIYAAPSLSLRTKTMLIINSIAPQHKAAPSLRM